MRFILLIFIVSNYVFAVKDILLKPIINSNDYVTRKVLLKAQTYNYPELKSSRIRQDEYNIFIYSNHFRVIYGKDRNEEVLANTILNIAENVWHKEIGVFGFKMPINSDKYYIDIYIGNENAYNKATSTYITIGSSYGGYAGSYQSNKTPYFVINPSINIKIIEVTIAHEFFHTIQYAYGLDGVTDSIWYKNLWFLEASAVMMEDEVYNDVNDYIGYLPNYFHHTYKAIDDYDGYIEYGKVVFAKFLKEKYGMDFIKHIFSSYAKNETILQDIQKSFKDYGTSFDTAFSIYATWLYNPTKFKEGFMYPSVITYSFSNNIPIKYYGIKYIDIDSKDKYLYGNNTNYFQETFSGESNIIDNINNSGLILINKIPNDTLYTKAISNNHFKNFILKKGWNLLGNSFDKNLNLESLLKNDEIAWIFENNHYYGFSKNSTYENDIKKLGYYTDNPTVKAGKGFWLYTTKDTNISIYPLALSKNIKKDKSTWNLVAFNSTIDPKYLETNATIVWEYDNGWKYYSNHYHLNVDKIKLVVPEKGYFIK